MGPILRISFGMVVGDQRMIMTGLRSVGLHIAQSRLHSAFETEPRLDFDIDVGLARTLTFILIFSLCVYISCCTGHRLRPQL